MHDAVQTLPGSCCRLSCEKLIELKEEERSLQRGKAQTHAIGSEPIRDTMSQNEWSCHCWAITICFANCCSVLALPTDAKPVLPPNQSNAQVKESCCQLYPPVILAGWHEVMPTLALLLLLRPH